MADKKAETGPPAPSQEDRDRYKVDEQARFEGDLWGAKMRLAAKVSPRELQALCDYEEAKMIRKRLLLLSPVLREEQGDKGPWRIPDELLMLTGGMRVVMDDLERAGFRIVYEEHGRRHIVTFALKEHMDASLAKRFG